MTHSSPDISLDIWGPLDLAKVWGIITVALRSLLGHNGAVTVDISWTSSPAKGYHDRTRRDYDMTMDRDGETPCRRYRTTEGVRGT